jgi:hypothetical protein
VVEDYRQADLVEEVPSFADEACVDEVQVLKRNQTAQQGEDPRQAHHVQLDADLFEEVVEVPRMGLQNLLEFGDMLITFLES